MAGDLLETSRDIEPSAVGRLSGAVYERILALIVNGEFALNTRLPSEVSLSRQFGASRPVVREALARLREDKMIVSRQGSGSYVVRQPDHAVLRFAPAGSIADIQRFFEFRAELESAAAAVAAERRQPADLAAINGAFDALEATIAGMQLGVDEDIRFHAAVAAATHNPYYVSMQAGLRLEMSRGMTVIRNLSLLRPAARLRLVQDEHRAIVDAIDQRDTDAARAAMKSHIHNARQRMFEGAGNST
jgi:GntR family transcriptional regulator, transcriptional repressor for pyruvate dehydrogenase complex